jgi:DNA-binding transcriptional LysR family regulator
MLLTRRAEELLAPLQDWLAQVDPLVLPPTVEPERLTRRFRIITSEPGLFAVVMPALPAILAAAPGAAVDIVAERGDPREQLASGEADLAVSTVHKDRHMIHDRLLMRDPYICIVRAGHPMARQAATDEVSLADCARWPHVAIAAEWRQDGAAAAFLAAGIERRVAATLPSIAAAGELLTASDAILFAPAWAARDLARDWRLRLLPAPPELGGHEHMALWHNRSHRDPAVQWLIGRLARHCHAGPAAANDARPFTLAAAE